MSGTFFVVTLQMLKNRVISRIKRLRNPRYLLSTLFGLAYFWFMFLRKIGRPGPHYAAFSGLPLTALSVDIASIVVLVMMIGAWALPEQSGGLEFSEAEIQFLFGAPLTRSQILLYKLMRGLPGVFISATMMWIFGFRHTKGFGLLFVFGVLSVYFVMVALGRARLKQMHVGAIARIVIVAGIFVALSWLATIRAANIALGAELKHAFRSSPGAAVSVVDSLFHSTAVDILLFVPRLFATAIFPSDHLHLFISCAALVVLGVVFFFIAARLNVAFEEASIGYSKRVAERRERRQQQQAGNVINYRRGKPLFALADAGRAEVAFIWKNTNAVVRASAGRLLLLFVPIIAFGAMLSQLHIISTGDRWLLAAIVSCGVFSILALAGPMMIRNDLRLDLPRFEVLKTYPLSGETIVAGEIAAPLALICTIEIAFITLATICFRFADVPQKIRTLASPELAVIAVIFVVPVCALQLLIQNAAVVLFPAWAVPSKEDIKGFVASGQRLLMLFGYLVVLALILLPAAAVFVPCLILAQHYLEGTPIAAALTTVPPVAVLVGEIVLAVKMLGSQFERLDVSADL